MITSAMSLNVLNLDKTCSQESIPQIRELQLPRDILYLLFFFHFLQQKNWSNFNAWELM